MSEVDEEAEKTKNQRPEGPPLRKVRLVELHDILTAHGKWLESEGKEGERADLSGANLQGAYLAEANLQKADLRWANLIGAFLIGANLQEADLSEANLEGAKLFGATLHRASLEGAVLIEAFLIGANLQGAFLTDANLQKAGLRWANLIWANLQGAFLTDADGLTASQVKDAYNWELAFYSDDFLKELGLPPDHNERVKKKVAVLGKVKKGTGAK